MLNCCKSLLTKIGIGVTKSSTLEELKRAQVELEALKGEIEFKEQLYNSAIPKEKIRKMLESLPDSKAQLRQDLFALMFSGFKKNGFFVEFGATDGISLSNTFLLEKKFGWNGILAEPSQSWQSLLRANRNVAIESKCVWSESNLFLTFNETSIGELSTLDEFSSIDMHSNLRLIGKKYEVETISLEDLLVRNNAPAFIDFLSIDTEGSEFEIIQSFNFDRYSFGFICCEHNYTQNRELTFHKLTSEGYVRIFQEFSKFDDWYIRVD